MDPKTETLALLATPRVDALSGARVREELNAIFAEETAESVLARLDALGVGNALGMRFVPLPGLLLRLRELAHRYRLELSPAHIGFLAVEITRGKLDELMVDARVARSVDDAHRNARLLRERLGNAGTRAEIVEAVEGLGPETALFVLALEDDPKLREYFEQLRAVRLEVDGDDLAALGLVESPRVGEILAELRRRKLNGMLGGRVEELAAARELIAE
jgi:tRNA nucleotidyltransferase/poly(A) polymerase